MRLTAPNAEPGDYLGCSLAISDDGNTIISGTLDDKYRQINAGEELLDSVGAAHVFVRTGGKWSPQAYVKAFNAREDDQFGWALAMGRDGNTIAIGSHLEDSGAKGVNGDQSDASMEDSGAVYVYTRTGTTWNPTAYVKASNTKPAAEFGISVALNGDGKVLAAGAGIDDAHYYRADNIEKAASEIPDEAFSILLSHTPEIYLQAAHAGFRLVLSGHTHGGQICLPGSCQIYLVARPFL